VPREVRHRRSHLGWHRSRTRSRVDPHAHASRDLSHQALPPCRHARLRSAVVAHVPPRSGVAAVCTSGRRYRARAPWDPPPPPPCRRAHLMGPPPRAYPWDPMSQAAPTSLSCAPQGGPSPRAGLRDPPLRACPPDPPSRVCPQDPSSCACSQDPPSHVPLGGGGCNCRRR
jgi:hypothetical protein